MRKMIWQLECELSAISTDDPVWLIEDTEKPIAFLYRV